MTTDLKPKTEAETLFANLDKPSLHALSYALRHPDTWPEGFVWDYSNCSMCAMGLAHQLWASIPQGYVGDGTSLMARKFAMPYESAERIFFNANHGQRFGVFPISKGSVTPEMVADKIDTYRRTAE